MDKIFITEPDILDTDQIKKLEDRGYLVIVAKDESKVKMIDMGIMNIASANDLFMAAMKGCNRHSTSQMDFADELYRRLKAKEPIPPAPDKQ